MVMLLQISHLLGASMDLLGDTSALINYASKAYNDKDVAAANLITISGLTIDGITGGNNSAATDYP